jgi:hypothetical protein
MKQKINLKMETQIMPQPQLVRTINAIDKTIFTVTNLLPPKNEGWKDLSRKYSLSQAL